jgi:hypothetical protein
MVAIQEHRFPQVTLGPVRKPVSGLVISAMQSLRSDALTEEQLVVDVYVQVITFVKSFLIYVRWDQVWGTGGHLRMRVSTLRLQPYGTSPVRHGTRTCTGPCGPRLLRTRPDEACKAFRAIAYCSLGNFVTYLRERPAWDLSAAPVDVERRSL